MSDLTRLLQTLQPTPDGESAVRHRTAVVDAVNADGTVDLDFDGTVVPDISVLDGAVLTVADVVQVAVWAGDLLVLGRTQTYPGAGGTSRFYDEDVGPEAQFTNTTFLDLDALTGGTPLGSAVAVTVTTGTSALVMFGAMLVNTVLGAQTHMGYRISGATTFNPIDDYAVANANTGRATCSIAIVHSGLTPGVNTFELVARVVSNAGRLERARLTVIP